MTVIASRLQDHLGPDARVVAPDQLDPAWQARLESALVPGEPRPALVYPQTVGALAAAIALAQQERWPLLLCGRGSKLSWGKPAQGVKLILSTQDLNTVIEHAASDLTVTVAAGLGLADLQATLRARGQFLPLDPAYPETATLGGIVATADTGSWRQRYGSPRDLLLGLSVVRADGAIAKAGGRVVKNVAGYDLMKLFTGSYGSLGAIAQLTFRTYPWPEASATSLVTGAVDAIAQARTTLLQSALTPTAVDLLSPALVAALGEPDPLGLLVRFQSLPASVTEQVQRWQGLAQALGLTGPTYTEAAETELWAQVQAWVRQGHNRAIAGKIGLLPAQAATFLAALATEAPAPSYGQIHASSGVGYLGLPAATPAEAIARLRAACEAQQGYLTLLEAPQALKQALEPWGYRGNAIALMQALKAQFDPDQLLSPGRFWT